MTRTTIVAIVLGWLSLAIADGEVSECRNTLFRIDTAFEGGALAKCTFTSSHYVDLTFRSEDSAVETAFSWYAFRVTANEPAELSVRLRFPDAYVRYRPKLSSDGATWSAAQDITARRVWFFKSIRFDIPVSTVGTWVSAQELLTLPYYDQWLADLAMHEDITTETIGHSVEGRPIHLASSPGKQEAILLLGRQHPAEVPGALAMREFVDTLLDDTDLARRFRERFMLLILPLLNPDGVVNGHARHNAGGTDLNRDWGPFTQPETQSVAGLLKELDESSIRPRLMLDFHATKMSPTMIFYTQTRADDTDPPLFATKWLSQVDERVTDYEFTHDPRAPLDSANTKNYFFRRYGIPAITYEIGDEADRDKVIRYTPIFAEEVMRSMLESTPTH